MVNISWIIAIVVLCAFILVIVTVVLLSKYINTKNSYQLAYGRIKDFYKNTAASLVNSYEHYAISPIIEYNINGMKYEFIGNYYNTSMKIGDSVKIYYNEKNPEKAIIRAGMIFAPLITGGLAVAAIIAAICLLAVQHLI